jgi:ankyrin repeat protein
MKTTFKIIIGIITAALLLAIAHVLYHRNDIERLAQMIANGDVVDASRLIASYPKLANAEIDPRTRIKPLHLAANRGQDTICSDLITGGADVNAQDLAGETPLYFALATSNSNTLAILLQRGANVALTDTKGDGPLYYAVIANNTGAVSMLLKYGADPALRNKAGKSPLDYAKESTNEDVVKLLSKQFPER